ncbi:MAG: 30S ribosomal protein S20 [Planctomycetes bacterium]|nr:30S ribosomal protein S20 [Planctomycetota bacterium]
MPHSRSSKKRVRQSETRRAANVVVRGAMRATEKQMHALLAAGKAEEAKALLPQAFQKLDKAAKRHVIHANTASNHKSKLSKAVSAALKKAGK